MGVGIYSAIALFLGILFDFLVGDPQGWYHPVMAVGWLVKKTEQALRGIFPHTPKGERLAGGVLAAVVGEFTWRDALCWFLAPSYLPVTGFIQRRAFYWKL